MRYSDAPASPPRAPACHRDASEGTDESPETPEVSLRAGAQNTEIAPPRKQVGLALQIAKTTAIMFFVVFVQQQLLKAQ